MKKNSRYTDSLKSQFTLTDEKTIILKSSNDLGVRLNGGRNGARFAPEAIINVLAKMTHHHQNFLPIKIIENWPKLNNFQFEYTQDKSSENILYSLKKTNAKKIIHLGGGHDHAYPFLKAIQDLKLFKNILILNIDAHCDTRVEENRHSGTPFRDFDHICHTPTHIIQYGIHEFANSDLTLSPLKTITENKILKDIKSFDKFKACLKNVPFKIDHETFIYFSLDADALNSSFMTAVSAVNHDGIELIELNLLLEEVYKLKGHKAFGIYEYNPLYDDLSQKGSRAIAGLIYNWLTRA